jgi:hypothetical protein
LRAATLGPDRLLKVTQLGVLAETIIDQKADQAFNGANIGNVLEGRVALATGNVGRPGGACVRMDRIGAG